jgi:predicted small lipoprotein YifL
MFERLKTALVDSYVGAIALGVLFSGAITRFLSALIQPISILLMQGQMKGQSGALSSFTLPSFQVQQIISQLIVAALYLLIGYGLLRWLYYPPAEKQDQEEDSEPDQAE